MQTMTRDQPRRAARANSSAHGLLGLGRPGTGHRAVFEGTGDTVTTSIPQDWP